MPITGTNFNYPRFSGGKGHDLRDAFAAVDAAISAVTVGTPSAGVVVNSMVNAAAAIAWSKMANLTAAHILVGNGSNVATDVAVTGDIAISNAGVVSITADSIINADIKTDAAIAWSKMATSTDISSTGTVTDLTITGEAQGEVLYFNGTNWVSLNVGTAGQALITAGAAANPYWGEPSTTLASKLTATYGIESGTYDIAHSVTTQTVGTTTLTIPDFANVNDTYAFVTLAQTLANKTLSSPTLTTPKIVTTGSINDAGGDEYLKFVEATTPVTYIQITSGDTTVMPRVQGAGETNIGLLLMGSGTGKVTVGDAVDPTKAVNFSNVGATTGKTTTLTFTHTDDRAITFPDYNCTLASLAGIETLTNKTLTAPKIATAGAIVDAGGDEYIVFTEAGTPVTYIGITSGNTTVRPQVRGAGETNTGLLLAGTGTGNVVIGDGADITKIVEFSAVGATTGKKTTLTFVHTDDRAITFPNFDGTLATLAGVETFTNKTHTLPKIATGGFIVDAAADEYLGFITGAGTPVTYATITSGATTVAPAIRGDGETNTGLLLAGKGTGKVKIGDGADITKTCFFELVGATTNTKTTLTFSQSADRVITFPNATDTLVGKATTDIFTNKTLDCDGTGNVVTNVNGEELDSVALGTTAVTGVPFDIIATISNLAAAGANLIQNSPYKYLIYGAELINTSAPDASATWQLCQGSVGAVGTAITEAVAADNADKIKTTALSFDDSVSTIASGSGGDLCVIGDASGTLDGILIVHCIRLD